MKRTYLLIVGLVIVAILIGAVVLSMKKPTQEDVASIPTPTLSTETEETPSAVLSTLQAGGSSYSDPAGLYSFLYPNEYVLDTSDPLHLRIYKRGATQTGQTEMFDGVIMVYETINLSGKTLSEWIDGRIQESTSDGTTQITSEKKVMTVNGYSGFTYTARGLGEAVNIYVQKDATSPYALGMTTSVSDPENKGYQNEVDATLSTLQILK